MIVEGNLAVCMIACGKELHMDQQSSSNSHHLICKDLGRNCQILVVIVVPDYHAIMNFRIFAQLIADVTVKSYIVSTIYRDLVERISGIPLPRFFNTPPRPIAQRPPENMAEAEDAALFH